MAISQATEGSQNSQAVQAYRLTQLETTVANGFIEINKKLDDISSQRPSKEETELMITLALVPIHSELQTLKQDKTSRDKWVNRVIGILSTITASLLITVIGNLVINTGAR